MLRRVSGVGAVAVAGDYAALVNDHDSHYGGSNDTVAVFDLRTGTAVAKRGGESVGCGEWTAAAACDSGSTNSSSAPTGPPPLTRSSSTPTTRPVMHVG